MAAASLLAARGASAAAHSYISVGALTGFSAHLQSPILGALGGEVSYAYYPMSAPAMPAPNFLHHFGAGVFGQAQSVGFNHFRFAAGPQVNFEYFGAEIGVFVEEGRPDAALKEQGRPDIALTPRATTFGLQLAPFVSIGFVSLSLRMGIPLTGLSVGQPYGMDIGMMGTIKLPIMIPWSEGYVNYCGIRSPARARRAVAQASTR